MKIIDINGNLRDCDTVAPDPNFPGFAKMDFTSKVRVGYKHSEWYPIAELQKNNPSLANLFKADSPITTDSLGVVSRASKNSLTDKTKKWPKDAYKGFPIWISRGLGEGQTRIVLSNSPDTLVVDANWIVVPDKTSQYLISHDIHNPQAMGNTLPTKPPIGGAKTIHHKLTQTVDKTEEPSP